jgi:hypothetical protein
MEKILSARDLDLNGQYAFALDLGDDAVSEVLETSIQERVILKHKLEQLELDYGKIISWLETESVGEEPGLRDYDKDELMAIAKSINEQILHIRRKLNN